MDDVKPIFFEYIKSVTTKNLGRLQKSISFVYELPKETGLIPIFFLSSKEGSFIDHDDISTFCYSLKVALSI